MTRPLRVLAPGANRIVVEFLNEAAWRAAAPRWHCVSFGDIVLEEIDVVP